MSRLSSTRTKLLSALLALASLALLHGAATAQLGGGGINNPFPVNPADAGGMLALLHAELGGL
jgi:hypothetical protein